MSWMDHTPECWTATPPDNNWKSRGANAGLRWLLPPHDGKHEPIPVIGALNFNACVGVDYWTCEGFPPELRPLGIHFPSGDDLAAAGWLFGPAVLGPEETRKARQFAAF